MIAHILNESELEELCSLWVRSLWDIPRVVRHFVVNFLIGEPFFAFVDFMVHSFVSMLCVVSYERL